MGLTRSSRQYMGVRAITPPDLILADRAPTTSDTAYVIGDIWVDKTALASYQFAGTNWIELGTGAVGDIATLTGDTGGAIPPVGANIDIAGDATSGIITAGSAGTITISAEASNETQRGTARLATPAEAVAGLLAGVIIAPNTLSSRLASPGAIGGTTPGAGTFTTITANGNIVKNVAGNKDVYTSFATTTAAGANSAGYVTLVGGTATVATTAVTAGSQIRLHRQSIGATGAAALGILTVGTISAGVSFVINAVQAADATALQATDVSVIWWEIVN